MSHGTFFDKTGQHIVIKSDWPSLITNLGTRNPWIMLLKLGYIFDLSSGIENIHVYGAKKGGPRQGKGSR